jgi:hypothetical protein
MMRGRQRGDRVRVLPQGATLVIEVEADISADELLAIGRAMSSDGSVVFLVHGKVREER